MDILVISKQKLSAETKQSLARIHILLSNKYKKNIELSVITEDTLKNFVYPTPFEFHFSESHKDSYIRNNVDFHSEKTDYDLAAHFVIAKKFGITLFGTSANKIFPNISRVDYLDSLAKDAEWSFDNIVKKTKNDKCSVPKYAVLNFCRVLAFIKDNKITSKKTGGEWGISHLPEAYVPVVKEALKEYRKEGSSNKVSCKTLKGFAIYANKLINKAVNINRIK